jgi:glucoamylase
VARTVTIAVPAALLGTPGGPGWSVVVALTGQDGFRPDQARSFAPTAQPFAFGVCAPGNPAAICSADPDSVPKAMDVLTPSGVAQDVELNPLVGPVVLHGVPIG